MQQENCMRVVRGVDGNKTRSKTMTMTIEVTSLVNENIELKKKEKERVIKVLMDEYRR